MGKWTPYSGAAVITAATGAWQDCDLSAIVGTNTAVVLLHMTSNGPLMVRDKGGYGEIPAVGVTTGTQGHHAGQSNAGTDYYVLCKTDSSGIIQYIDPLLVGWTADVFLDGYFVPSYGGTHQRGYTTIPNTWTDRTIHVNHRPPPGRDALFSHVFRADQNAVSFSIRPNGEAGDLEWRPWSGNKHMGASGATSYYDAFIPEYGDHSLISETDYTGVYAIKGSIAGSLLTDYTLWSEYDNYTKNRATIFTAQSISLYSSAWDTVDLSSYVGQNECLAVLHLKVDAGGAAASYAAVRKYGESANFVNLLNSGFGAGIQQIGSSPGEGGIVLCPTDNQGRIEIAATTAGKTFDLDLLGFVHGYDNLPPSIDSGTISPSGSVVSLSSPENLRFRLDDPSGSGIDSSTFNVTATDQIGRQVSLVSAGSLASGIAGYIAPADTAGIGGTYTEAQVVLDWPESLLSGQRYTISVDATNKIGYSI